jgi:hypothetical protein
METDDPVEPGARLRSSPPRENRKSPPREPGDPSHRLSGPRELSFRSPAELPRPRPRVASRSTVVGEDVVQRVRREVDLRTAVSLALTGTVTARRNGIYVTYRNVFGCANGDDAEREVRHKDNRPRELE